MRRWGTYILAGASVMAIVLVLRLFSITTAGTAAPLLLVDVVIVARFAGFSGALVAALVGAAAYLHYFLPSAGFAIEDPDDWVAFLTFLGTAMVTGELASRAERRAAEAQAARREVERLYRELEGAFDRASEAEAARRNEQLKAALLDALTHNLRTPLTAIKAAVTALIGSWNRPTELSNEGRQELLEVIDEESDRLNRFIEGLSNPEQREPSHPSQLRSVCLEDLVRAALVRAEIVIREHRVLVALENPLLDVSVEPASAVEVLYMVLDNASKYAPAGTRVVVGSRPTDGRTVTITVSDEGPGIDPDLRERVFEKFFRVPAREPLDYRRGGVGLGLSIARRLIEAQGGRIWIEAGPGDLGTTVAIALPVVVPDTNREDEAAPVLSSQAG